MNVSVIQHPPFEPLSLAEVYLHLRLDPEGSPATHPEDAWLTSQIKSARRYCEKVTRRSLIQQTLRLSVAAWGAGIELQHGPVMELLSVSYYDSSNVLQTLDAASYYLTDSVVPQVRWVTGFAAPGLYDRPDAVRVEYVAGYAPEGSPATTQEDYAGTVPEDIKSAMKLLIGDAYCDREAGDAGNPRDVNGAVQALLGDYVVQLV